MQQRELGKKSIYICASVTCRQLGGLGSIVQMGIMQSVDVARGTHRLRDKIWFAHVGDGCDCVGAEAVWTQVNITLPFIRVVQRVMTWSQCMLALKVCPAYQSQRSDTHELEDFSIH